MAGAWKLGAVVTVQPVRSLRRAAEPCVGVCSMEAARPKHKARAKKRSSREGKQLVPAATARSMAEPLEIITLNVYSCTHVWEESST